MVLGDDTFSPTGTILVSAKQHTSMLVLLIINSGSTAVSISVEDGQDLIMRGIQSVRI